MKKRFGRMVIGGILLILFSCVSVFAISKKSVNYHLFSKKTAVRIEYYVDNHGTYIPLKDEELTVMPGEFISRIPVIFNEGLDCYIRVKVAMVSEKEPSVPITMENIVGMSEKWIPIGDYFYYKDVFLEDEAVEVFDGIRMPTEWVERIDCGNQWEVQVKVDAIQSAHMVPNYQSEDPWGEHRDNFQILDAKENEVLEDVIEEEEWKKDVLVTIESKAFQIEMEEIFLPIGDFVPGDEKKCTMKIRNLDENERILYLKTEIPNKSRLPEEMKITVLWECEAMNTVLYQGPASQACDILEQVALVVSGNGNGFLHVVFSLPKTVDNDCTALEGSFRFLFSDEKISSGNQEEQKDFMNCPEDTDKDVNDGTVLGENSMVQTGDDNRIWNAIVGLCIGVCLFFLYLWKGKRGSHEL